jgi:lipopolysaccharide transport system permease protein
MIRQFAELRGFGYLFRNFLSRDLSTRYKGSLLGVAWSLMNPLVMMAIYTVVFSVIFPSPQDDYAISLLAAYLPFFFFSTAVGLGVSTLVANAGLIKKVYFPRELLPLSMTAASFINFLLTLALLLPVAAYARGGVNPWALLALIPVGASFFLATAGLVMLLSALNVYFRDVEFLSGVLLTVLFYLTPVVYTLAYVQAQSPRVAAWLTRNPLTPFTEAFRNAIYYRAVPVPIQLAECAFIGVGGFLIGYAVFNRLKGRLAEEL